ncbi:pilus assembly protein PilM [Wenzhouxiangella sp. AB-CW3]|uniref:pilus assembly protein PilM n=1 Tax=Wenzhouxiangella sp. AB-CW3 TaxID=2771012 RepID=UPI00168BD45D|nr:pilus assembly protein PilM [Wenzhouxiangella sp. AB-CW3]QOC23841.1 pilus assembly protein PilM [Wenzhouxiangella sp. AB-CW3]
MRQHATSGVHLSPGVMSIATVAHDAGRKPRLVKAGAYALDSDSERNRLLREDIASNRTPVHLVLDNDRYELLLVEAPRVDASELRAAVRWKIKSLIDFHIDDAVIDVFEIPGQENRPQGQRMMYAIAARARDIRKLIDLFESADLNLQVIDVADLAMRNLAAQLDDDVRGVAMLYLNEHHGLITVTRQGSLYLSRRLDTGYGVLQERGSQGLDQAMLEVQRSLDYYDRHFAQPPVASLQVLPGYEATGELVAALDDGLAIPTRVYDSEEIFDCEVPLPQSHTASVLLAIGGALRREEISL